MSQAQREKGKRGEREVVLCLKALGIQAHRILNTEKDSDAERADIEIRGTGARPMHPDWARRVRDDCAAAGVLFFLKRLSDGTRRLYGREHNALPWQVSE